MDDRSLVELRVADLLARGGGLADAAPDIAADVRGLRARVAVLAAGRRAAAGESTSRAIEAEGGAAFGRGFAGMVRAVEAHGVLARHLPELAELRAEQRSRAHELRAGLVPPLLTLVAALVAGVVTVRSVFPAYQHWLKETGSGPVPWAIQRSIDVVSFLCGLPGLVLLAAVVAGVVALTRRPAFAALPFRLGGAVGALAAPARAAALKALGVAVEREVPLADALAFAADVAQDRHVDASFRRARAVTQGGAALWEVLSADDVVPARLLTTVRAGQERGALPAALGALADYYRVEARAGGFTARAAATAALTLVAALLCGWIMYALATGYQAVLG